MRKNFFAFTSVLLFSTSLLAQESEADFEKKINRESVVRGMVIDSKGDTLKGYIRKMKIPTAKELGCDPDNRATTVVYVPDAEFGSKVKFISEEDFRAKNRVHENDYTKCKPDKFKGYIYDLDGENLTFTSMKVKDGILKQNNFVRVVRELPNGELLVDYYKSWGVEVLSGPPTYEEVEPYIHTHPAIFMKDKGLVVLAQDQKPEEFYKTRCPEILKKWNDNKYTDVSSKKESKLNKLAKLASKVDTGVQNEARLKAFQDYLDTCAK